MQRQDVRNANLPPKRYHITQLTYHLRKKAGRLNKRHLSKTFFCLRWEGFAIRSGGENGKSDEHNLQRKDETV